MVSVKTSASLVMISMIALMSRHTSSQPSPIYQNKSGNLKLINKENSTNSSDIQKFKVSYCLDLGSSCTSCHDRNQQTDEIHQRVCKQEFREIELWVLGDNGKDQVRDSFLVPDGCQCISV